MIKGRQVAYVLVNVMLLMVFTGWFCGKGKALPIPLKRGTHLLIDDYLIEVNRNVRRKVNQPKRFLSGPVVKGLEEARNPDGSNKKRSNFNFDVTVWYDSEDKSFKMTHSGWYPENPYTPVLRESTDSIHWSSVKAVLDRPSFDDKENTRYPGRRFKSLVQTFKEGTMSIRLGEVWFSPDGKSNWMPYPGNPVFTPKDFPGCTFDGAIPYFNPILAMYGAFMHVHNGSYTYTDVDGLHHKNAHVRQVWYATSQDFKNWSRPKPFFSPDSGDKGITQFYGMTPFQKRGDYFIAMLRVLRDDIKAEGVPDVVHTDLDGNGTLEKCDVYGMGYTVLAWTRDGINWHRDRYTDKFLEPDPDPNAWDHAHAWAGSCVPVGDEVYIYYGGYKYGHKIYTDRQIGIAKIKRDRYVAREAGDVPGIIRTPLVTLDFEEMTLNVDAKAGEAKVQVLDENGNPVSGFTLDDCQPIRTDSLDAPVKFTGHSLRELGGIPVHLEFSLTNARLFAFTLSGKIGLPTVEFKSEKKLRPSASLRVASEGVEADMSKSLVVLLSEASDKVVTVDYKATGGTANGGGVDYSLENGTLRFNPGETIKRIWLDIVYDDVKETDETIEVRLHNPTNARLGNVTVHTYTIHDDGNKAPVVDAGNNRYATLPVSSVKLNATVTDDGLPGPPLEVTMTWSKDSGPGTVTFGDKNAVDTAATFSETGTYQLRLTGDDGRYSVSDTIKTVVNMGDTPLALSIPTENLKLWVKADADMRKNSKNLVKFWFDQSGNGHRFDQSKNGRKPRWTNNALNGKPALSFDGNNDDMRSRWPEISAGGRINERTIIIVFKTGGDVSKRQVLFKQGDKDLGLNIYIQSGNLYINGFNVRTGWNPTYVSASIDKNTPYYAELIYNCNDNWIEGFLNGQSLGRERGVSYLWGYGYWASIGGVYGGTRFPVANGGEAPRSGRRGEAVVHNNTRENSGSYFEGQIAEILYYNSALSDSERRAIEDYIEEKYDDT